MLMSLEESVSHKQLWVLEMTLKIVVALLVLNLAFAICGIGEAAAQTEYSIDVSESTWNHATLKILLIPQVNESWWDPMFINLTLQAVDMWNNALTTFAFSYKDFDYISNIRLSPTEYTGTTQNFDVYISWTENPIANSLENVGLTELYSLSGAITSCNITLAAKDGFGIPLTNVVKQGVATHELGHALGLYHTNSSEDTMFRQISFDISVRPISTLDAYGVARVFHWRSVSSQFHSSNQGSKPTSVSLPSEIEYEYLNAPQQDFLSRFISSFLQHVQTPKGLMDFTIFSIVLIGFVAIVSAVYRFIRSPKKN